MVYIHCRSAETSWAGGPAHLGNVQIDSFFISRWGFPSKGIACLPRRGCMDDPVFCCRSTSSILGNPSIFHLLTKRAGDFFFGKI